MIDTRSQGRVRRIVLVPRGQEVAPGRPRVRRYALARIRPAPSAAVCAHCQRVVELKRA